ncbi:cobalt-precorrin-5B (C(1))-methyltransferase [Rhodanobacter aciditrophus]|uniref:Cobalt-precorrin-5B C(1)-methyltransferase n=1 Tax=Rhodanobacter aciditrophus TaxID=1623218 RepID=A0ABW4AXP9_9GAMM
MWPESGESKQPLRTGLTTGTCATACCVAAAQYLFTHAQVLNAEVTLPKGKVVSLTMNPCRIENDTATASTVKDAGDDPDATHGATVFASVRLLPETGVRFKAGEGVGTVTRTGLVLEVGEPAINPVPRQMMTQHLEQLAKQYDYTGGFEVTVGIENGATIAQKTMNPRLGILGGLSILGTTGIVRPFSCAAYIASIHQGIDVARANQHHTIAATTGNASETAIQSRDQLDPMALIEMGDFVGAALKHLKKVEGQQAKLDKFIVCGGFGKISKLAQGHLDLNSRASSIDLGALAELARTLGGDELLQDAMGSANTSVEALAFAQKQGIPLADEVCRQALKVCRRYIPEHMALEVLAIDRKGNFVGQAIDLGESNDD